MIWPDPALPLEEQADAILLAILVWGEARGESALGQSAVAHVPITRVKTGRFGRSARTAKTTSLGSVILQRYQFSCFNLADPNRAHLLRPIEKGGILQWSRCLVAAVGAIGGSENPAPEATHYCTKALWGTPGVKWFQSDCITKGITTKVAEIGNHIFARTR